jgi:hypothetical protein
MHLRSLLPALLIPGVVVLPACRKPPEAPAKLEALAGYLFEHMGDEDTDALSVGVHNLDKWLDGNFEATLEGYTIENPSGGALGTLDGKERKTDGMVGAAVASRLDEGVAKATKVLTQGDFTKVYEGSYLQYDRTYSDSASCYNAKECEELAFKVYSVADYPVLGELRANFKAEYRWVEFQRSEDGEPLFASVQRTWLVKPADVDVDWLTVPAQYFLGVNIPHEGGTRRLQATWILAELSNGPAPESVALNLVVGSMQDSDVMLNDWLNR